MIIHITDNLTYDTDKKFDEQDVVTQDYLYDIINNNVPDLIDTDEFHRETCRYWNINAVAILKYQFIYERPETAWNAKELKIEMEVRYE